MCEYKRDTGSDNNVMAVELFKVLFLDTKVANLNKYTDKKVM